MHCKPAVVAVVRVCVRPKIERDTRLCVLLLLSICAARYLIKPKNKQSAADTTTTNGFSQRSFCLTSSGTDLHVDAGPVFQAEAVGRFVPRERLAAEAELERFLVQALPLGEDGEDDPQRAPVP